MANACVFMTTCSSPPTLLELIKRDGELRVVTRNGPTTLFEGTQGPGGFEYELLSRFADFLDVDLALDSIAAIEEQEQRLFSLESDLIAAGLTVTPERSERLAFGAPFLTVSQQVIYRIGQSQPREPADLVGKRIVVPAGSSFSQSLRRLAAQLPDLTWEEAPEADVAELLYRLSRKEFDVTIADSHEYQISRQFYPELRAAFDLSERDRIAWALRPGDDTLQRQVDAFFALDETRAELQRLEKVYFGNETRLNYVGTRRFLRHIESRLPKLKPYFEQAARDTGLPWQLLAAVGYQESHWRRDAVSPTGVRGIMMLTRLTASSLGVEDRTDPEQSIQGGSRYLVRVKRKVPERIVEPDRTYMALAAYNVGYGHLEDARIITQRQGRDPDSWEDVREHLPLLAQQKWYSQVKRGYARGWEPVKYVDNIRSYYDILIWATSNQYRNPFEDPPSPSLTLDGMTGLRTIQSP